MQSFLVMGGNILSPLFIEIPTQDLECRRFYSLPLTTAALVQCLLLSGKILSQGLHLWLGYSAEHFKRWFKMSQVGNFLAFHSAQCWPWQAISCEACRATPANHMLVMYTSLWLADILRVAKRSILLRTCFSESEQKYPACGMFVRSLPSPTRLDYNLRHCYTQQEDWLLVIGHL